MTLFISRLIITLLIFCVAYFALKRVWTKKVDLTRLIKKPSEVIPIKDEDYEILRPDIKIGNRYERDKNAFVISIQTGENKELIKPLIVKFKIKGTVNKIIPGFDFNSEPCKAKINNAFILGNTVLSHSITLTFDQLISGVLNNTIIYFDKPPKDNFKIDVRVYVEWYWNYKGETQRETKWLPRNYENKNFIYEKL